MNRTLTDADIAAIVEGLKGHTHCNLGLTLTPDQASLLKRILEAIDGGAKIVGRTILTAIILALIAVFTKGFWFSIISGIKAAGFGK